MRRERAGATVRMLCGANPGMRVTALVLTGAGTVREDEERAALAELCAGASLDVRVAGFPDNRLPAHWGDVKQTVVALREGRDSAQGDGAAEILMVRQYRHPVRAMLWEVPAGLLDVPGEEPLVAAQRELAEETDFAAARWDVLVDFYASPGFTTEGARSYLARDLRPLPPSERVEREAEEAEFVPTWFRLDDVLDAVMAGRLHNPSTVVGVLAAARARSSGWAGLRPTDAGWLRSPRSLRAG